MSHRNYDLLPESSSDNTRAGRYSRQSGYTADIPSGRIDPPLLAPTHDITQRTISGLNQSTLTGGGMRTSTQSSMKGGGGVGGGNNPTATAAHPVRSRSSLNRSTTGAGGASGGMSDTGAAMAAFRCQHPLDVRAEVDRMYQNILHAIDSAAGPPPPALANTTKHAANFSSYSSPAGGNGGDANNNNTNRATSAGPHQSRNYADPSCSVGGIAEGIATLTQREHRPSSNYEDLHLPSRGAGARGDHHASFGHNDFEDYATPRGHHHEPFHISGETDRRVAAMQSLLRNNHSTSNLYRRNTFGSGRKGMSEPVNKADAPGPGSYFGASVADGGATMDSRHGGRHTSSGSRAASPFRDPAGSACRTSSRSGARPGCSFGKAERKLALGASTSVNVAQPAAARPPGPGDYTPRSTFENAKPTSTKGSFGKAAREGKDERASLPGPGQYAVEEVGSQRPTTGMSTAAGGSNGGGGHSAAFASKTQRMPSPRTHSPGPASYKTVTEAMDRQSTLSGKQHQGYTIGKAPVPAAKAAEITPGPGDYCIDLADKDKDRNKGVIPTAPRDDGVWGGRKKLSEPAPGPGSYSVLYPDEGGQASNAGVSFKFRYREKEEELPGPGQYDADVVPLEREGPKWSMAGKPLPRPIEETPGPGQYDAERDGTIATGVLQGPSSGLSGTIGRAARDVPVEETPGPGSYEVPTTSLSAAGASKFGSAVRTDALDGAKKDEVPGPNVYDPKTTLTAPTAPATTLSSTTARFAAPTNATVPGPGTYETAQDKTESNAISFPTAVRSDLHQVHQSPDVGPGSYENPITFNSGRAVSISLPIESRPKSSNGGSGDGDGAVGPGAYDAHTAKDTTLASAPRAVVLTEGRFGVPKKDEDVPGPGAYDDVDPETWLFDAAGKGVSFPRAVREQADSHAAGKENLGPGSYDVGAVRDTGAVVSIPTAPRFAADEKEMARIMQLPGPGSYDIQDMMAAGNGISFGTGAGHEQTSTENGDEPMPGPGEYDTGRSTLDARGVVIGTSAQRELDAELVKNGAFPGPGHYQVSLQAVDPHSPAATINARQDTVNEKNTRETENLGPGSYDPREVHRAGPAVSFLTAPRLFDQVSGKDVPGPGWYAPERRALDARSYETFMPVANRFVTETSDTPGPGYYDTECKDAKSTGGVTIGGTGHAPLYPEGAALIPGPGTYDPRSPTDASGAPTINARDRPLGETSQSAREAPGPGAYSLPETLDPRGVSFGSSLRPALHADASAAPGPGMYDPFLAMRHLHEASPAYSFSIAAKYGIPDSRALVPGPGAYVFPTPYAIGTGGPSHGFGTGQRPTLHPNETCDMPGPGAYEANGPRPGDARAPAFSITGSARQEIALKSEAPGPGAYGTLDDKAGQPRGPAFSFGTGRAHEGANVNPEAAEVPGPGTYETRLGSVGPGGFSFGGAPKLEAASLPDGPGPGHYNPLLYAEGPFYSIAGKYPAKEGERPDGPGPGAYDTETRHGEGPTYSVPTAERFPPSWTDENPGPGAYDLNGGRGSGPAIGFSTAVRMPGEKERDIPGPGAYEVGQQRDGPFYSMVGKNYPLDPNAEVPGPGAYDTTVRKDTTGAAATTAPRFPAVDRDDVPGPGQYHGHDTWSPDGGYSFPQAGRAADRELAEAAQRPGPGQYAMGLQPQGPFYSILGKPVAGTAESDVPGPGAYGLPAGPSGPSAFLGTAMREGPETKGTEAFPGPGAYRLPPALSPLGPRFATAVRLPGNPDEQFPGPGMYDVRGREGGGPHAVFGTAVRAPDARDENVPGPGLYNYGAGKDAVLPRDHAVAFGRAGRPEPGTGGNSAVGPGQYNLGQAPYAGPAYSFPHGSGRGNGAEGGSDGKPGPGEYGLQNLWGNGGPTIQGKWQEADPRTGVPGPGHYRVQDFDPYARDRATVIDFSRGGERLLHPTITTAPGPGEYYRMAGCCEGGCQRTMRILERFPAPFSEPTPGPADYHNPNVVNPFYDPLAR